MGTTVIALSVLLQISAAVLALRLTTVSGGVKAWLCISSALVLMAVRRAIPLVGVWEGKPFFVGSLAFELVGLAISALMVVGVALIAPLFRSIRQSREELKESEERYRRLFDSGNDAVFVYPVDGRGRPGPFVDVNEVACGRFGYGREELLRLTPADLLSQGASGFAEGADPPRRDGLFETSFRTKDGGAVPVEVSFQLFDLRGRPTVLSIVRDVTERRRAEAERESLIAELQAALAQVKTLSGLLPICASCKKIRDEKGSWNALEQYIEGHSQAEFSHGLCPECARQLYPQYCK